MNTDEHNRNALSSAKSNLFFYAPLFSFSEFFLFFYFIFLRLPIFLVLTTTLQAVSRLRAERHRGQLPA
jgi:hypothetical protein